MVGSSSKKTAGTARPAVVARGLAMSIVSLLGLLVLACDEEPSTPAQPSCTPELDDRCIGPLAGDLCAAGSPADGLGCSSTIDVAAGDDLASVASGAAAGACLLLAPGSYGDAVLPAGVSLVGCGVSTTTLGALTLDGGDGAVVYGVEATGIKLDEVGSARIEQVRVRGASMTGDSSGIGIEVQGGGDVTVVRSDGVSLSGHGLFFAGGGSLTIEDSAFEQTDGSGVWVQCASGCDCPSPPAVALSGLMLTSNAGYGIALLGVDAMVRDVQIADTAVGGITDGGGGLVASGCASIDADGLHIEQTARFGAMIHGGSGVLGGEKGIIVVDGKIGIWLHDADGAEVRNFELRESKGVGLGISGESKGIIVVDGKVANTGRATVPGIDEGGVAVGAVDVSDGILWRGGASAELSRLTIVDTDGNPLRIVDPVTSGSLQDIAFEGSGADKAILHQNVQADDPEVPTSGTVPAIDASEETEPFAQPPATPQP